MTESLNTFHANGKLLLSGEYLVLHGAMSLALPIKMGQILNVYNDTTNHSILWKAFYQNEIWFSCELNPEDFSVIKTSDREKAVLLSEIFKTIRDLQPQILPGASTRLETFLDANPLWGFGSSSTLISLLSQWLKIDPFNLNKKIFNGSGFDIACAMAHGPILYIQDQESSGVDLDYPFADQLLLVYSGKKKKTHPEIQNFLSKKIAPPSLIQQISDLSIEFANCHDQNTFNRLIEDHEKIVGELIGQTPVKESLFPDFQGQVKSLGAWGGDFFLASGVQSAGEIKKYFENKGFSINFNWNELILKP